MMDGARDRGLKATANFDFPQRIASAKTCP